MTLAIVKMTIACCSDGGGFDEANMSDFLMLRRNGVHWQLDHNGFRWHTLRHANASGGVIVVATIDGGVGTDCAQESCDCCNRHDT